MGKFELVEESKGKNTDTLIALYLKHGYSCAVRTLLQCICCRGGGLGWASEVRQVLSCGASAPGVWVTSPVTPKGVGLGPEGWVGEVFPDLFWLEVGGVGGLCLCWAS